MVRRVIAVKKRIPINAYQTDTPVDIETLEGTMHANVGDWIITGPGGERWPVKNEVFTKTYQILKETDY